MGSKDAENWTGSNDLDGKQKLANEKKTQSFESILFYKKYWAINNLVWKNQLVKNPSNTLLVSAQEQMDAGAEEMKRENPKKKKNKNN